MSFLSRHIKSSYKRVARAIGYALITGEFEGWLRFSVIVTARLTSSERAALAWAALTSLDTPEQAEIVAEGVLRHAGPPLPTFMDSMGDARWWASMASLNERKSYALAAYEALPLEEQMSFRNYISEVEVAV